MSQFYLTQGLHRAMQQNANKIATICGDRRRTFKEVGDRVARLAGALQQLGMRPNDRVGMLSLNSDRYLEYYLAVWWGGGVVNPVNIRWSPTEIAYSLDDCDTGILLIDDAFLPMLAELKQKCKSLRIVIYAGDGEAKEGMLSYEGLVAEAKPVSDAMRCNDDLAGVFYTGGTTGFPKGVMLTHASLVSSSLSLLASGFGITGSVGLHLAPMFHLADFVLGALLTARGDTHAFVPAFNPEQVLKAIQDHGVTTAGFVPTMIQMVLDFPGLAQYQIGRAHV